MSEEAGLSVYDFDDYRAFMVAWMGAKKARSVRFLANRLGVSPGYVSMVRQGKRNLKVEHARHWAVGLGLDEFEQDYFEAMVRAKHAATDDQRRIAQRQVDAARAWRQAIQQESALRMYSNWYVVAMYEFAKCDEFRADPEWIAAHMVPAVTVEEAADTLALLQELGFLIVDGESVQAVDVPMSTGLSVSKGALANALVRTHKAWLKEAVEALSMPADVRFLSSVTFALDAKRLEEVVEVVRRLQIEAAEATTKHDSPDRVYELGIALIPRTDNTPD